MTQFVIDFLIQNTIWSVVTSSIVVVLALTLKRQPALVHLVCIIGLVAMLTPPLISISVPGQDWLLGNTLKGTAWSEWPNELVDFGNVDSANLQMGTSNQAAVYDKNAVVGNFYPLDGRSTQPNFEESRIAPQDSFPSVLDTYVRIFGQTEPSKILFAVWAFGSLTYLIYVTWQYVCFCRMMAVAKPARESLENETRRLSHSTCFGRCLSVKELDANVSPFVFLSVNGPQMVMPSALADQLSKDELQSLIMHELVHIKRRDPEIRFLELIVATVFWFNPSLWLIRWLLRETEELACDAVVTDSMNSKPEVYAGAFLKTIDFLSQNRVERPASLVCTVGGYRSCRRRLEAMVNHSNHAGVSPRQRIATATFAIPILFVGLQLAPVSEGTIVDATGHGKSMETGLSAPTQFEMVISDQDELLTTTDMKVMKELSEVKETPNLVFHCRPADLEDNELNKVIKINQEKFDQCQQLLKMKYRGKVHIFLYRDVEDLQKMTGVSAAAFSTGTVSVHQTVDFHSVHELVHIFALQFPKDEDEVTDMFAVEGLATILAKTDENIPIHSWAAIYQSASRIPSLVELRRSWPNGVLPGVHPYHIAGSFVGYLIDEYGIEKVKRWYVHSTEAHMEFGKTFRRLERDWLAWLKRQTVESEHRKHIWEKLGLIPKTYSTAEAGKQIKIFDGQSLDQWQTDEPGQWKVERGVMIGRDDNNWTYINTRRKYPDNIGVRFKFRLLKGKAVTVRLNCTEDSSNHVNLATWATYVSATDGGYVGLPNLKLNTGEWNEVVVVNDEGTAKFYLNDIVIGEFNDVFHQQQGTLGVGVEGGILEVKEFIAIAASE